MRTIAAFYFAVAAITLIGCVAPDYGGGDGGMHRKKKMGAMTESYEPAPVAYRSAAPEPLAPAPAPAVSGIGARLQVKDGAPSIAAIIPGGPAAKDGRLQVGDVLTGVAQGDGPFAPTEGMTGSQVVALVRGETGTIVRLKVLRGGSQTVAVSLVRASVDASAIPVEPEPSAAAAAAAPASPSAPARRTVPSEDYTSQLVP
jgi:hypothetical protein